MFSSWKPSKQKKILFSHDLKKKAKSPRTQASCRDSAQNKMSLETEADAKTAESANITSPNTSFQEHAGKKSGSNWKFISNRNTSLYERKSSENSTISYKKCKTNSVSSKLPVRVDSKTNEDSKANFDGQKNESFNKIKCNPKCKNDQSKSRRNVLPAADNRKANFTEKRFSNLKRTSLPHINVSENISQSFSRTSSPFIKEEKRRSDRVRETVQAKEMLSKSTMKKGKSLSDLNLCSCDPIERNDFEDTVKYDIHLKDEKNFKTCAISDIEDNLLNNSGLNVSGSCDGDLNKTEADTNRMHDTEIIHAGKPDEETDEGKIDRNKCPEESQHSIYEIKGSLTNCLKTVNGDASDVAGKKAEFCKEGEETCISNNDINLTELVVVNHFPSRDVVMENPMQNNTCDSGITSKQGNEIEDIKENKPALNNKTEIMDEYLHTDKSWDLELLNAVDEPVLKDKNSNLKAQIAVQMETHHEMILRRSCQIKQRCRSESIGKQVEEKLKYLKNVFLEELKESNRNSRLDKWKDKQNYIQNVSAEQCVITTKSGAQFYVKDSISKNNSLELKLSNEKRKVCSSMAKSFKPGDNFLNDKRYNQKRSKIPRFIYLTNKLSINSPSPKSKIKLSALSQETEMEQKEDVLTKFISLCSEISNPAPNQHNDGNSRQNLLAYFSALDSLATDMYDIYDRKHPISGECNEGALDSLATDMYGIYNRKHQTSGECNEGDDRNITDGRLPRFLTGDSSETTDIKPLADSLSHISDQGYLSSPYNRNRKRKVRSCLTNGPNVDGRKDKISTVFHLGDKVQYETEMLATKRDENLKILRLKGVNPKNSSKHEQATTSKKPKKSELTDRYFPIFSYTNMFIISIIIAIGFLMFYTLFIYE